MVRGFSSGPQVIAQRAAARRQTGQPTGTGAVDPGGTGDGRQRAGARQLVRQRRAKGVQRIVQLSRRVGGAQGGQTERSPALGVPQFDIGHQRLEPRHVRGEGRITAARSGSDFSVNGFPVIMGGQRDYRQGSADDIVIGAAVRVEGEILNDASIQVHRVWFLHD